MTLLEQAYQIIYESSLTALQAEENNRNVKVLMQSIVARMTPEQRRSTMMGTQFIMTADDAIAVVCRSERQVEACIENSLIIKLEADNVFKRPMNIKYST